MWCCNNTKKLKPRANITAITTNESNNTKKLKLEKTTRFYKLLNVTTQRN